MIELKKKGIILVILMIVLGVAAFMSLQQTKDEEKAVEQIINERQHIDTIIVKKGAKTIATLNDDRAYTYVEATPLAKIENLERATKKKFEKGPIYTIQYQASGNELYTVDVFRLKKGEALTGEENDYSFTLNGREMMLVWQPYEERLSQNEKTQKMLQKIVE